MDHHRNPMQWLLLAATCVAVGMITYGYGPVLMDAVSATGLATADEIVWLARQGQ